MMLLKSIYELGGGGNKYISYNDINKMNTKRIIYMKLSYFL